MIGDAFGTWQPTYLSAGIEPFRTSLTTAAMYVEPPAPALPMPVFGPPAAPAEPPPVQILPPPPTTPPIVVVEPPVLQVTPTYDVHATRGDDLYHPPHYDDGPPPAPPVPINPPHTNPFPSPTPPTPQVIVEPATPWLAIAGGAALGAGALFLLARKFLR